MRALFAGYGSIARRHISNLRQIAEERDIGLSVDLLRSRGSDVPPGIVSVYTSPYELEGSYDAVFVTNPTSCHYDTLLDLIGMSGSFFIEKPVFDRVDLDTSVFPRDKLYYVACPLRYSSAIQWVKQNVDFSRVRAVRAISSSYLPDWRPCIDYRETYSAHADMGGGVHIDLVHEWDYLVYLMGYPDCVKSVIARKSSLEIDSCDVAAYVAEYKDKVVEVHLDYFGRAPIRRFELFMDEDTLACDLLAGRVEFALSGQVVDLVEERDDFQKWEIEHFLDLIVSGKSSDSNIQDALSILMLARGER